MNFEYERNLTEKEAADWLGYKSVKTLQNRRWAGLPPKYLKLGRAVRYRPQDLREFMDESTVNPVRGGHTVSEPAQQATRH